MATHKFTDYYLVVNLDERGEYSASVYDPNDKSVFEIESAEQVNEMQTDGFLKYAPDEDLDRLTKYLMNMDVIPNGSQIWSEEKFEDSIREQYEEEVLGKGGKTGKADIDKAIRALKSKKIVSDKYHALDYDYSINGNEFSFEATNTVDTAQDILDDANISNEVVGNKIFIGSKGGGSMVKEYEVELSSVGNPDFGQDPDKPLYGAASNKKVKVYSFKEASEVARKFIRDNNLGGGNWSGGAIYKNGKQIAFVSYNGRVWEGADWNKNSKEIKLSSGGSMATGGGVKSKRERMLNVKWNQALQRAFDVAQETFDLYSVELDRTDDDNLKITDYTEENEETADDNLDRMYNYLYNSRVLKSYDYSSGGSMATGGGVGKRGIVNKLMGKRVVITSDNDNYDRYKGKELIITHAEIGGRGYDDSVYPEALVNLKVADTGESVPFALYEYEFDVVGNKSSGGSMATGGGAGKYSDEYTKMVERNLKKGRTPKDIWTEWTNKERTRFLREHLDQINIRAISVSHTSRLDYDDLPNKVQYVIESHRLWYSSGGSMAKGGEVKTEKEIDELANGLMEKLKEDGRTKRYVNYFGRMVFETIKKNKEKEAEGKELYYRYHSADQHSLGVMQNWGLEEKEVLKLYKDSLREKYSAPAMGKGGEVGELKWTDKIMKESVTYFSKAKIVPDDSDNINYLKDALDEEWQDVTYEQAKKVYDKWNHAHSSGGSMGKGGVISKIFSPSADGIYWLITG